MERPRRILGQRSRGASRILMRKVSRSPLTRRDVCLFQRPPCAQITSPWMWPLSFPRSTAISPRSSGPMPSTTRPHSTLCSKEVGRSRNWSGFALLLAISWRDLDDEIDSIIAQNVETTFHASDEIPLVHSVYRPASRKYSQSRNIVFEPVSRSVGFNAVRVASRTILAPRLVTKQRERLKSCLKIQDWISNVPSIITD